MLKVLIADDENLARDIIKLLLSHVEPGVRIHEAENGHKALCLANQHQPDIVVLDIEMPGISGIEVSKRLPTTSTVIFATAFSHYKIENFEPNIVDFILKPFDDERFYVAFEHAKKRVESMVYSSFTGKPKL